MTAIHIATLPIEAKPLNKFEELRNILNRRYFYDKRYHEDPDFREQVDAAKFSCPVFKFNHETGELTIDEREVTPESD